MSISSVTSKVIFVGTGSTASSAKIFAYPFKIFRAADLTVTDYNINTSVGTVKTLNTDYAVSGVGVDSGGNVTLTGSYTNLATSSWLVIQREVDLTQEVDYVENDAFPAETHEQALDKLTMITQQLQEQLDRAIKANVAQITTSVAYVIDLLNTAQTASASSAAVAVSEADESSAHSTSASASAVLASTYAGAIDFTKDNDTALTSNSDSFVASQKATKTYVDAAKFVDRGNRSAADITNTTMTTNNTWVNWDISSIVSSGANAVLFRVMVTDDTVGSVIMLRTDGYGNETNAGRIYTQVSNGEVHTDMTIAVDSTRIVEYKGSNTTFSSVGITVGGWWV